MFAKNSFICLVAIVSSLMLMMACCLFKHTNWTLLPNEATFYSTFSKNKEPTERQSESQNESENSLSKRNVTEHETQSLLSLDLMNEMQHCSKSMGVSFETLQNTSKLEAISNKAATFLSAFWEVVPHPRQYLHHTKSPCWYSNIAIDKTSAQVITKSLREYKNTLSKVEISQLYKKIFDLASNSKSQLYCLPYFFIAGFPKSGTTSLHAALSNHPQISSPGEKETHWWARVPLLNMERKYLKLVVARYLLNFMKASESIRQDNDIITYDGSQSTVVDTNFGISDQDYCAMAAVVHKILPDLKLIFIMRDPVERLHSHFYYMHNLRGWPNEMKKNSQLYFSKSVTAAVKDFRLCRKNYSLFECANLKSQRKKLTTWLGVGIYYIQILEWLQFWPRENFLFLKTEDLSRKPGAVMNKITQFLGLDSVSEYKSKKWLSKAANVRKVTRHMHSLTRKMLEEFYKPYNMLLESFLKDYYE